jgi:hypothetical protein
MLVDAFVLPVPGRSRRSLGVVFWDRPRSAARNAGGTEASGVAVYAPGPLSPGEMVELRQCLTESLGTALRGPALSVPRFQLWVWWAVAAFATLFLALRAIEFGLAFAWLALLACGTTLPFGLRSGAGSAARAASRLTRRLSDMEAIPGEDPRQRERLAALWQTARKLRGGEGEQLRALHTACVEHSWPAAARVYADLASAGSEPARPQGRMAWLTRLRRRIVGGEAGARVRPYGSVSMRAWP